MKLKRFLKFARILLYLNNPARKSTRSPPLKIGNPILIDILAKAHLFYCL
jgi:hypothetical protein